MIASMEEEKEEEKLLRAANGALRGLGGTGPLSELKDELSVFGLFVGDWDILEDRLIQSDGSSVILEGELHWCWILHGRAGRGRMEVSRRGKATARPGGNDGSILRY
jgi:hypothetical protein